MFLPDRISQLMLTNFMGEPLISLYDFRARSLAIAEVLVVILLMISELPVFPDQATPIHTLQGFLSASDCQAFDGMEFFAGCNIITRMMRATGRRFAGYDISFFNAYKQRGRRSGKKLPTTNFFDLLTPQGFISAIVAILSCKAGSVIVLAVVCSSWVSVSRGTTHRTYLAPKRSVQSVVVGNLLAARQGQGYQGRKLNQISMGMIT